MSDKLQGNGLAAKFNDPTMVFAVLVVVMVLMLIIPIPAFLLDTLMVISVLSGIMVVLTVSYAKTATDFSVFPTLLLVTTILRLSINVSSTRLILTQGADFQGKMVRAFGEFVVGSSDSTGLVVGVIIFVILVIVQFMVITKGATRVSEVAARFSLDKMPNKFMAIDMEVQNGVITEAEAIKKRQMVDEESAFYGSMDGASKFVQGDVIVGILITIVNVIGGFSVGMLMRNEPFDVAVQNYVSLTIGDGLVGQIPSLLISFGTGLIVTRAQANDSVGNVLWKQITRQYRVFTISGITLLILAFLPGFPHIILAVLGGAMIFAGMSIKKEENKITGETEKQKEKAEHEEKKGPEDVSSLLKIDPLTLHIGYELIPLVNGIDNTGILNSISGIRRSLAMELGLIVPPIRIQDNIRLNPNEYVFKIKGQDIGKGVIKPGCMMAMGDSLEPIEGGERTVEPAFGLEAYWVREDQRVQAENMGYTVVDPPTIVSTHIQELLRSHSYEILDREAANELLENVKKDYPIIVSDILNEAKYSKSQIQKILQALLTEGVSIRDLPTILETLSEYNPQTPLYDLVEIVRQSLKRVICNKYKTEDKELFILRVHPKIENEIYKNLSTERDGEPIIRLNPDVLNKIQIAVRDCVSEMYRSGYPPVIVTQPQIRRALWEICQYVNKNIAVLSSRELVSDLDIHMFMQVSLEEKVPVS